MGNYIVKFSSPHLWKEDEPDSFAPIKYDPQFGFENKRPLKVIQATEEEMDSANIELESRDFCALQRIRGFLHELEHCYYEERVQDMKEFEREKRLNKRERRIIAQG